MSQSCLHHLPRLDRVSYQAFAVVHWSMRVVPATSGWLDVSLHEQFRELMLHVCARENLLCPTYCLMPDHLHVMLMGMTADSDQIKGMKFLREHLNRLLAGHSLQGFHFHSAADSRPQLQTRSDRSCGHESAAECDGWKLQRQAYDHVLKDKERKQNAFAKVCFYILANPVRADLVSNEREWTFSGAILPGYPELHPLQDGYWELFWKLYWKQRNKLPADSRLQLQDQSIVACGRESAAK